MAEIFLTFALEETLKKVGSLAVQGIQLGWEFKENLLKLKQSLEFIGAVLHDAEERQAREASVKIWLQKLREVAYEAEDVLDEFGYEVLRRKVETTPTEKVRNFFSASSNPIAFRLHMGKKFKKINDKLAKIKDDAVGFGKNPIILYLNQIITSVCNSADLVPALGKQRTILYDLQLQDWYLFCIEYAEGESQE
ncbi:hypothetical protein Tsubulata_016805 [Turnera subulata]|uniref:Disease resistance N-terminal domain-containing protein n=1 Tax=Turnera subulata TaxID=218843 RepID=A0A9Q0F581_9ROSI|nr:hypothetical protein Tsubulata_016805 [Turnera subulata]